MSLQHLQRLRFKRRGLLRPVTWIVRRKNAPAIRGRAATCSTTSNVLATRNAKWRRRAPATRIQMSAMKKTVVGSVRATTTATRTTAVVTTRRGFATWGQMVSLVDVTGIVDRPATATNPSCATTLRTGAFASAMATAMNASVTTGIQTPVQPTLTETVASVTEAASLKVRRPVNAI